MGSCVNMKYNEMLIHNEKRYENMKLCKPISQLIIRRLLILSMTRFLTDNTSLQFLKNHQHNSNRKIIYNTAVQTYSSIRTPLTMIIQYNPEKPKPKKKRKT